MLVGLVAVSGCSAVTDFLATETPAAVQATATPSPTATPATLGVDSPITLQLWLPPEFDPSAETDAAILLQARLDEYSRLHPGVRVQTRVKANTGSASLINSLSGTSSAAPLALPDLVLLSTKDMQNAAERSLIFPVGSEIDFNVENDWYPFAAGLAGDDQIWGVPFTADGLVMIFRPSQTENPPASWSEFLNLGQRLMFPVSDPAGTAYYPALPFRGRPGGIKPG